MGCINRLPRVGNHIFWHIIFTHINYHLRGGWKFLKSNCECISEGFKEGVTSNQMLKAHS